MQETLLPGNLGKELEKVEEVAAIVPTGDNTWIPSLTTEEFRRHQQADPDLQTALSWLEETMPQDCPRDGN